ncbi:DUF3300 domain-containing protein [Shigella flexneri]
MVYIPNYNPTVVYGNWANTAYPPSPCATTSGRTVC